MASTARSAPAWVIGTALVVLTLLVFWPVGGHEYISLDDPGFVAGNPQVNRGLTLDGLAWAFSTLTGGNWHPLTWVSHMLSVELFGPGAGPQHLVNLGLHVVNVLLLFRVLNLLTGVVGASAFVAALFAIHPLHVESVAWISERKDVLSTCFWMLALLAYLRSVRSPGPQRLLPVLALFGLGLMAKPMLVTLPFLLLLLDFWPLGRLGPAASGARSAPDSRAAATRCVLEKAPLFLLSAGASLLAFAAQIRSQTVASLDDLGLQARVANALLSYLAYLGHTLWPRGLAVFYPYAAARLGLVALLANAALLAGITAAVLAQRRRPYLACGWLWYLGTLVPVIGLVQAGLQARADRYTYVPLVGIFILVAWGGRELLARLRARPAAAAACATLVVLALAAQARVQVGYWQDNLSLFRHNLEVAPDDAMSLKNLGIALAARGQAAEANRLLARAYELDPRLRSRSHYNLGRTLAGSGNYADAVRYLREAVRISPGFGEARGLLDRILRDHPEAAGAGAGAPGDAHGSIQSPLTRGEALARSGRYEDAAAAFREAIRLEPELAGAHNNLGCALAALGRFEEAGAAFREAVRLRPDYAEARRNLARCLAERRP